MYTKVANVLKLVISVYFVYIGVELIEIMMDQRPGDLTKKLLVATFFMIAGAGYFVWTLGSMSKNFRGKMKEARTKRQEEAARAEKKAAQKAQAVVRQKKQGVDNSEKFRTAPMYVNSDIVQGTVKWNQKIAQEAVSWNGEDKAKKVELMTDLKAERAKMEKMLPDSWDDKTKAMWLDSEREEDSLQQYWDNNGLELEPEPPSVLMGGTRKLPVVPQDTREILAVDGATRAVPDISDFLDD